MGQSKVKIDLWYPVAKENKKHEMAVASDHTGCMILFLVLSPEALKC